MREPMFIPQIQNKSNCKIKFTSWSGRLSEWLIQSKTKNWWRWYRRSPWSG